MDVGVVLITGERHKRQVALRVRVHLFDQFAVLQLNEALLEETVDQPLDDRRDEAALGVTLQFAWQDGAGLGAKL